MNLDTEQSLARDQFLRPSQHHGKSHLVSQADDLRSASPHLRPRRGERLLDIATDNGHAALYFARLGLDVTASVPSPAMLEAARSLADSEGLTIDFREHPAEKLPYPDEWFNIITCRAGAHRFSCPATFMMEVCRVLKPAGRFLLIDGTVEDGYPVAETWAHEVESLRDPSHEQLIRPDQWTHLCGHIGMKVIHREIQSCKQPDLDCYFDTAATPEENRKKVRDLVRNAPSEAVKLFKIKEEEGKWTWWWQHLILVAVRH